MHRSFVNESQWHWACMGQGVAWMSERSPDVCGGPLQVPEFVDILSATKSIDLTSDVGPLNFK